MESMESVLEFSGLLNLYTSYFSLLTLHSLLLALYFPLVTLYFSLVTLYSTLVSLHFLLCISHSYFSYLTSYSSFLTSHSSFFNPHSTFLKIETYTKTFFALFFFSWLKQCLIEESIIRKDIERKIIHESKWRQKVFVFVCYFAHQQLSLETGVPDGLWPKSDHAWAHLNSRIAIDHTVTDSGWLISILRAIKLYWPVAGRKKPKPRAFQKVSSPVLRLLWGNSSRFLDDPSSSLEDLSLRFCGSGSTGKGQGWLPNFKPFGNFQFITLNNLKLISDLRLDTSKYRASMKLNQLNSEQ